MKDGQKKNLSDLRCSNSETVGAGSEVQHLETASRNQVTRCAPTHECCDICDADVPHLAWTGPPDKPTYLKQLLSQSCSLLFRRSVHKFATEFAASKRPLSVLVNNAGEFVPEDKMTQDGFEVTVGTNHFGARCC